MTLSEMPAKVFINRPLFELKLGLRPLYHMELINPRSLKRKFFMGYLENETIVAPKGWKIARLWKDVISTDTEIALGPNMSAEMSCPEIRAVLAYSLDDDSILIESAVTTNILRSWPREQIERFALHLLGDNWQKSFKDFTENLEGRTCRECGLETNNGDQ